LSDSLLPGARAQSGVLAAAARKIGIAPEGAPLVFAPVALAILAYAFGFGWTAAAVLAVAVAIALFFRDPDRFPARTDGVVLSAADGRVIDVSDAVLPGAADTPCRRVSVFMSPLDVHVNRAPVGGVVSAVAYSPGAFRAAFGDRASEHNERNLVEFRAADGRRHAIVQVAGYLARRIVCRVRNHDKIQPAQRIGLIMFGSRVDHFVPAGYRVVVNAGSRVRAGLSAIAELDT
jgi:phosphatidylserine decarboxylase